jgi:saccharopine dehydrogenase-like NADP-dependent oxidoreductase
MKRRILVLGAGRSSTHLIEYLIQKQSEWNIQVRIGDASLALANDKVGGALGVGTFELDANDHAQLVGEIAESTLVISMLPAFMHVTVARICLDLGKHLITPSYVAPEMKELHEEAESKGLYFLNEMGVDPGIDHMSAMRIIEQLKSRGCEINAFYSLTGGLIAPASDNNPWNYKVTWNPRNIVMSGSGSPAHYRHGSKDKLVPYHRLFSELMEIEIPNYGMFEGYPNRDSMSYEELYGLHGIETLYRGTLRRKGFCRAWDVLVQLGMTDDTRLMNWEGKTMSDFTQVFLPENSKSYLSSLTTPEVLFKLQWLGLWDITPVPIQKGTPAQVIQALVEDRWALDPMDRDMIAMCHIFEFVENGKSKKLMSFMVNEGTDAKHTAMSATVGLPMALSVPYILNGAWKNKGVLWPLHPEVFHPILNELSSLGVHFFEEEFEIND